MKSRYLLTTWIITGVIFCMTTQSGVADDTVHLANGEWPPYFSEKLPHHGIGSRIVTEAFALEGITVAYTFYPWKRGLIQAQHGTVDGVVGYQVNSDREPFFYVSETVWDAPWVFFHRKEMPFEWECFDDLTGYRVGGTIEYMYTVEFLEAERAGCFTMDRTASDNQNFLKLLAGRIDIFPQLIDAGYYQIEPSLDPSGARSIIHHPRSFGTHTDQLLLSKKIERNARLIQLFNKGLRRLKASGEYDRYFDELRKNRVPH